MVFLSCHFHSKVHIFISFCYFSFCTFIVFILVYAKFVYFNIRIFFPILHTYFSKHLIKLFILHYISLKYQI